MGAAEHEAGLGFKFQGGNAPHSFIIHLYLILSFNRLLMSSS
jgi:hypothetical protein